MKKVKKIIDNRDKYRLPLTVRIKNSSSVSDLSATPVTPSRLTKMLGKTSPAFSYSSKPSQAEDDLSSTAQNQTGCQSGSHTLEVPDGVFIARERSEFEPFFVATVFAQSK